MFIVLNSNKNINMNLKYFITITNHAPSLEASSISFAPTGNIGLATWVKLDKDFNWIEKVLALNTDVCLFTNEEISLETAAHLVLAESEVMEKFIWKDTVAYSQNELISMASLENKVSWQDVAFADRLIFNDKFPSNYYFAKKINPLALSIKKNINKVLEREGDQKIHIERINDELQFFIIPFKKKILIEELLHIMNNLLIGGQNSIYKLEARHQEGHNIIGLKKVGEKIIQSINISDQNSGNYIFGVINATKKDAHTLLEFAFENLDEVSSHIHQVIDETLNL